MYVTVRLRIVTGRPVHNGNLSKKYIPIWSQRLLQKCPNVY